MIREGSRAGRLAALASAPVLLALPTLGITSAARADRAILEPGTVIPVRLDSRLSSRTAQSGDTFTATVNRGGHGAYEGYGPLPLGTHLTGVVDEARPREGDRPGM